MEQLASNLYPFTSSFNETSQTTNSANENAFFGDFGKNDTFLSGSENDDPFGMNDFGSIPKKKYGFFKLIFSRFGSTQYFSGLSNSIEYSNNF